MKIFCKKCGFGTSYNGPLPNKCSKCEFEFQNNAFIINTKNNTSSIKATPESETETSANFKNIKPAFKVTVYQSQSNTLSNLIDPNSANDRNANTPKDKSNNLVSRTSDQVLAEFQKEGSSIR
jgi:hypothetical protein